MTFSDTVNKTGNKFDVLNNFLQEGTLETLLINLITSFCSLKIVLLSPLSPPSPHQICHTSGVYSIQSSSTFDLSG